MILQWRGSGPLEQTALWQGKSLSLWWDIAAKHWRLTVSAGDTDAARKRKFIADVGLGKLRGIRRATDPERAGKSRFHYPNDRAAGRSQRSGEAIDVRHDLRRHLDLGEGDTRQHEAVLHIDDDQRGTRRVEIVENMFLAAARDDAVEGGALVDDRFNPETGEMEEMKTINQLKY